MLKRLLAAAVLLTACTPFKPTGDFSDVRGRVFSRYFNAPLQNASVGIPGYAANVRTDANGYFEIRGLPTRALELEVSHPSHQLAKRPLRIEPYGAKYIEVWVDNGSTEAKPEVVFERDHDIWVTDLYGMKQTPLTVNQPRNLYRSYPVWASDKKQIGYIAYEASQRVGLDDDGVWVMRADGTMPRKMTGVNDVGRIYHLDWSRDGKQFLFMLQDRVFVYDQSQGTQRVLTGTLARPSTFNRFNTGPVWSADGQRIVTTADSLDFNTNLRFQPSQRQIYSMNQQGTLGEPLTRDGDNYSPAVSHSGQRIAYVSTVSGDPEIWVMDINGSNPQQLTRVKPEHIGQVRWSADDQTILFTSDHLQQYKTLEPKELWAVDIYGQKTHMVTNDAVHFDG